MNLQEMLTTENPDTITDEQLKKVAYGLVYGEFGVELQARQHLLQARLLEIEAVEKCEGTSPKPIILPNVWDAYHDDSDDDEYEWS